MSDLQRPSDFFSPTEITYLRAVSSWRSTLAIVHCWGVIFGAWVMASIWTNPLTVISGHYGYWRSAVGSVCAHP